MRLLVLLFTTIYILMANESVAILKTFEADIEIYRDKNAIEVHDIGVELFSGDVLRSDSQGSASIIFNDGTIVTIGPKSVMRIDDYIFKPSKKKYNFELFLEKGTATFESGKISKASPSSVKFGVPEGTIGIRGTKFFVEVK